MYTYIHIYIYIYIYINAGNSSRLVGMIVADYSPAPTDSLQPSSHAHDYANSTAEYATAERTGSDSVDALITNADNQWP